MTDKNNKWEIIDVAVNQMKPGSNVRQDPHESELLALGESLKVWQHHPLILDPQYIIIDGWRRWLAARLVRVEMLKAIITDRPLSESELNVAQIEMSLHRAGLSGWELYCGCFELLQLNPGWLAKDLAQRLKLDPSYITRVLAPSKAIEPVRAALKAGKIGLAAVYSIAKEPEERQAAMLELKLNGASRDDIERVRRNGKKKRNGSKNQRVLLALPSGETTTVGGVTSVGELIQVLTEVLREAKRGLDQNFDLKTLETVMRAKAKGKKNPEAASA